MHYVLLEIDCLKIKTLRKLYKPMMTSWILRQGYKVLEKVLFFTFYLTQKLTKLKTKVREKKNFERKLLDLSYII